MRVLVITEKFPPDRGGLATSSRRIADGLASLYGEAHVVVATKALHEGDLSSSREGDVVVHRVGAFKDRDYTSMTLCRVVETLHARHPFDAIVGMYLVMAGYVAAVEGKILGVPSLVMARGNDVDRELFRPEGAPFALGALNFATAVGCVSRELLTKCRAISGRKEIYFTPNGVDAKIFAPGKRDEKLRAKLGIDGPVVGFSGELRLKKGMSHVVAAAEKLVKEFPKIKFLLLGGVRSDARKEFDRLVSETEGLSDVFVDPGYITNRTELVKMYRLMDVLFMPSFWEGTPNAALEAMACGVPVVSSTAGGLADVVIDGETGFTFEMTVFGDGLNHLVRILALPPDEKTLFDAKSRNRVVTEYSLDRELEAITTILRIII